MLCCRRGELHSDLWLRPNHWQPGFEERWGAYSYSPAKPHAVAQAGANSYVYDQNGNMTSRTVDGVVWTYAYNAENQLISTHKDNQLISEYGYDGDGQRVAEINADGTATIFIGNYFEGAYPEPEPPAQPPHPPLPSLPYKAYLPVVSKGGISFEPITARFGTLYFYADGERIAMKKDGEVYYLYGDQLGSVSAVADADGNQISKTLYHPWGTTRHTQGTSPTDYAFTGQMKEGDIYFYNARWYDPQLGRFMQADTIVPTHQGTQGFDRFAYINNNPVNGTDPTGHYMCLPDGRCYVDGWQDSYVDNPTWDQRYENTCWGIATSLGISIVTGNSITPDSYIRNYSLAKPRRLGGAFEMGLGVPLLFLQNSEHKYPGNYFLERQIYTRDRLKSNLLYDFPTVMQIPLPGRKFGHDVLAFGMEGDSFLFFSWGKIYTEEGLVDYFNSNYNLGVANFDGLMSYSEFTTLAPNSMMRVMPSPRWTPSPRFGGGGNWVNTNINKVR